MRSRRPTPGRAAAADGAGGHPAALADILLEGAGTAAPPIFAGLVAYRVIYYLLPLLLAGILLATSQRRLLRERPARPGHAGSGGREAHERRRAAG